MRHLRILTAVSVLVGVAAPCVPALAADNRKAEIEAYIPEPMPPGFQVRNTELEGNVFTDAKGHTLYRWPVNNLRNGDAGEAAGIVRCYDERYRVTVGFTSPYPADNELPNADTRPTCVQHWPPMFAPADAKPVGNFTILDRTDGSKQWAYKGYALYTSHVDKRPGETNGGSFDRKGRDVTSGGAQREPVGPAASVPPQFQVVSKALGRMVALSDKGFAVYAYDKETATKIACTGRCLDDWEPVTAPDAAIAQDGWSVVVRPDGARQWAYRGKPLYRHLEDTKYASYEGSDVPGWQNVFTQRTPRPPKGFQIADTYAGQVLTDPNGKTLYYYQCVEDTPDTLYCNNPDSPPEYRWAMCGGGDPDRCLATFPYVVAEANAKSDSIAWSIMDVEPKTGHVVEPGTAGSLRVWAYRGRPVYTFVEDEQVGDIWADSWGQDHGQRNGFTAFWVRDAFGALD